MPLKKNDLIKLDIESITIEGNGIGKFEGMIIFVPNAGLNDKLLVKILKVKKNYAYAKIEEILFRSEDRIDIDCDVYLKCGGCRLRHISYEAELKIKEKKVRDSLERIGKIFDAKINPIVGAKNLNFYRNKAQIPIGKNSNGDYILGFFAPNTHRIVECSSCFLQPLEFNNIMKIFLRWLNLVKPSVYDEKTGIGLLRHLYLRKAQKTNEIMVCIVINGNNLPKSEELIKLLIDNEPNIKSICVNVNKEKTNVILGKKTFVIYGREYIEDVLCGLKFRISPESFYQVNRDQAEKLYGIARKYANLKKTDTLFDLYCGTGTIGLTMAGDCKNLLGVEIVPKAIENARKNAFINDIKNAKFICEDVKNLKIADLKPDVVVIDPPRKGCSIDLINAISYMAPKRLVYVSCDPSTLARDLNLFMEKDYEIIEVTPVDMFPRTGHVETVVQLVRKKPDTYIDITVDMDELDLTSSEAKATYDEIKDYIFDKYRVKVSSLYVAQVKQKHGIIERDCYNNSKKENSNQPQCPPEKVKLIEEALRHFKMIP